jgi:hypothetical protein
MNGNHLPNSPESGTVVKMRRRPLLVLPAEEDVADPTIEVAPGAGAQGSGTRVLAMLFDRNQQRRLTGVNAADEKIFSIWTQLASPEGNFAQYQRVRMVARWTNDQRCQGLLTTRQSETDAWSTEATFIEDGADESASDNSFADVVAADVFHLRALACSLVFALDGAELVTSSTARSKRLATCIA